MAGVPGLSKSAADGLKNSLASQSAPPNPQTQADPMKRKDPNEATFLDLQRIRRSADVAVSRMDEQDPQALLVGGISACMTRLLSSIDLSDAVDVLLERLFPLSSPQLKSRLEMMFKPISPPTALGGGAPGSDPGQGTAGGPTGQSPAPGAPAPGGGEAGVGNALPA